MFVYAVCHHSLTDLILFEVVSWTEWKQVVSKQKHFMTYISLHISVRKSFEVLGSLVILAFLLKKTKNKPLMSEK